MVFLRVVVGDLVLRRVCSYRTKGKKHAYEARTLWYDLIPGGERLASLPNPSSPSAFVLVNVVSGSRDALSRQTAAHFQ